MIRNISSRLNYNDTSGRISMIIDQVLAVVILESFQKKRNSWKLVESVPKKWRFENWLNLNQPRTTSGSKRADDGRNCKSWIPPTHACTSGYFRSARPIIKYTLGTIRAEHGGGSREESTLRGWSVTENSRWWKRDHKKGVFALKCKKGWSQKKLYLLQKSVGHKKNKKNHNHRH